MVSFINYSLWPVTETGPSLFPLILCSGSNPSNGLVTIGCLAKDVPSALVRFAWTDYNDTDISASDITQYPTTTISAGTFTASSQVAVSADDWQNFKPFYCKAEGVDGVARIVRQTSQMCAEPEMIIQAPCKEDPENPQLNITLFCMVHQLHTANATIQWEKEGNILDSGFTTTGPGSMGYSCHSIFSKLTIRKSDWDTNKKFTCRVQDGEFSGVRNISKSSACPDCEVAVRVETIPPSFSDIYLAKSPKLTCRISNIPDERDLSDLNVGWTRVSDNKKLETTIGEAKVQENSGRFFVDATATICKEEWESEETFQCKVTYHLLPSTETRTLRKLHDGTPRAPSVYVLPPPSEQLALQETVTLTCLVKGFYPKDFFVQWLQNDDPVGASEYHTSEPIQESKTSELYFAYSTLNINEQEWSSGTRITCMVGHEALPLQTTQKTIDKNTGKPTLVNVSLVLSDTAQPCV